MPYLDDGTVIESHFSLHPLKSALQSQVQTHDIQLGQIITAYPIDDKRNISKHFTEYDVLVFEDRVTMSMYRNCRAADPFGNNVNFHEVSLQGTVNLSADQAYRARAGLRNGSMVLLACISGHKNQGTIIGVVRHPAWNADISRSAASEFNGAGTSSARDDEMKKLPTLLPGAKRDDGERLLGEFNGFRWHINKDGEFTVMCQGVKDASGNLTNSNGGTILKFDKSGRCTIIDRADQVVQIDPDSQKITIADGNAQPDQIVISGQDKTITIKSTSKVVLQDGLGTVNVGSANAIEPLVLGNQFQLHLTQLYTALNTYAGSIAAIADPSGTATSTLATQLATLTAQLQLLLSKKAFTELGP